MSSMVMSVDHPGLTFNLTLVRSEPTYNQPVQQWAFTSDFAVSAAAWKGFSGGRGAGRLIPTLQTDPHLVSPSAPYR